MRGWVADRLADAACWLARGSGNNLTIGEDCLWWLRMVVLHGAVPLLPRTLANPHPLSVG